MIRRTSAVLFRKTRALLSEGEAHILRPEDVPPSSNTRGFFGPLNGPFKYFRLIDFIDGNPPRIVDWNTKEAGYLPPGFESS